MATADDLGSPRFYNPDLDIYTDGWGRTVDEDGEDAGSNDPYEGWKGKDLKAEFERRNEEKDAAGQEKLSVEKFTVSNLKAALVADDEASDSESTADDSEEE